MRNSVLFIILLALLPAAYAKRYALVIGNSDYSVGLGHLKNSVNDATDMAELLRKKQFSVTVLKNATKRQMKEGIRSFTSQLAQNDAVGLFFFSGHGVEVGGQNYLIPVSANIQTEADVEYESINAGRILKGMEYAGNNLNMVILDACRNNPYARSFRSANRGLTRMHPPKGSLILYATSPGEVASDGEGRNGLFTQYLLQAIDTPDLTVEKVFKTTANNVYRATGKKQLPWQSGVMLGDFYFSGTPSNQSASAFSAFPVELGNNQAEVIFWSSIQNESHAAYFKSYLLQYPNGLYASLAKIKLDQINSKLESKPQLAKLTLNTQPQDARVRILNIIPQYQPGIELNPGQYHIEVSKPGYQRYTEWLVLKTEDKVQSVVLHKKTFSVSTVPVLKPNSPDMININGACYQMGSPGWEEGRGIDEQRYKVCIKNFQIGKKEVTVGEFRQFVRATGYRTQAETNVKKAGCYTYIRTEGKWAWRAGYNWENIGYNQNDKHPVACVSWYDVQSYINWLNENSAGGYRLPTEAEWEYAARAGTQTAYYWGSKVGAKACRYGNVKDTYWENDFPCDDNYKYTAPVGHYRANKFGLYDISGNVWEWTCSKYTENYSGAEKLCFSNNSVNDGDIMVVRGGSFRSRPRRLRIAGRFWLYPWLRNGYRGFRLARSR